MSDRARIAVGGRSNSSGGSSVAHDTTDVQACSDTNHSQNNQYAQSSSRRGQMTLSLFPHTYTYIPTCHRTLEPTSSSFPVPQKQGSQETSSQTAHQRGKRFGFPDRNETSCFARSLYCIIPHHIISCHIMSYHFTPHHSTPCTRIKYTMHQSKR